MSETRYYLKVPLKMHEDSEVAKTEIIRMAEDGLITAWADGKPTIEREGD